MASGDSKDFSKVQKDVRTEYASMRIRLGEHLIDEKLQNFKIRLKDIYDVPPVQLKKSVPDIIEHLLNSGKIKFRVKKAQSEINFECIIDCLQHASTAYVCDVVYDAWDKMHGLLSLDPVHRDELKPDTAVHTKPQQVKNDVKDGVSRPHQETEMPDPGIWIVQGVDAVRKYCKGGLFYGVVTVWNIFVIWSSVTLSLDFIIPLHWGCRGDKVTLL